MIVFLYVLVFSISLLTFFSGFGLGTLLLPFFALYFPLEIAIVYTAIVHFLNHLWKIAFLWRSISFKTVLKFGLPAMLSAILGAYSLTYLAGLNPIFSSTVITISPVKLIVGSLLVLIGLNTLKDYIQLKKAISKQTILGGVLSGFFGGLSGLQGAFRSYFLLNLGLNKYGFIATSSMIAFLVDITRLLVYFQSFSLVMMISLKGLGIVFAAFLGVVVGNFTLKKVKMQSIQTMVAWLLILMGSLLMVGML